MFLVLDRWTPGLIIHDGVYVTVGVPLCNVPRQIVIYRDVQDPDAVYNIELIGDHMVEMAALDNIHNYAANGLPVEELYVQYVTSKLSLPYDKCKSVSYYSVPANAVVEYNDKNERVFTPGEMKAHKVMRNVDYHFRRETYTG